MSDARINNERTDNERSDNERTGPSRLGIHARVWLRAAVCAFIAYGFIHLLIIAIRWLKTLV